MKTHVISGAKGLSPIGAHRMVEVADVETGATRDVYEYDARCGDCGDLLGVVRHTSPHPDFDPGDCGLICGTCAAARADAPVETEAAVEGEV